MNILIPHSWLLEFLKTNAKPQKIAEYISLCGPSVDKIEKTEDDWVYDIEITTNRVDMMSVYGIAREAAVILPQFGIDAKLKPFRTTPIGKSKNLDIKITNNQALCHRILAIKLENVKLGLSPTWLASRLKKVGQRPLNNAIDITNYVMWETGHPIHVFDYDRISTKNIIVREAKKGEALTTLDGKKYSLAGGEVVFDNGVGEIIDLPGIMGTLNTVVTPKTKNVLLWIESVDPLKIRKASMNLAIRSQAAILNEKHVDPELGLPAITRAVELFKKVTGAKPASSLVNIYPSPYKEQKIKTTKEFIDKRLGVDVPKTKIKKILEGLEFRANWSGNNLIVGVPSFRATDVTIEEDIVEEVARIHGYHNLPSEIMQGAFLEPAKNMPFDFEIKVKNILKGSGGIEVYNYSMVSREFTDKKALKLKNPLGTESEYMRTSLMPSLISASRQNSGEKGPFHIFEMANIYLPKNNDLPEEKLVLAGIMSKYKYRKAKGIVELLLVELKVNFSFKAEDSQNFLPNHRVKIYADSKPIGQLGILDKDNLIYYEFEVELLRASSRPTSQYTPIPKFPAQIEDISLVLPERTKVGEVIRSIKSSSKLVSKIELTVIFKNSYTFRIWYQHESKTLTDKEVETIRNQILATVKKKFGAIVKT